MSTARFQTKDDQSEWWAFIPGPIELAQPMDSQNLQEIVEIAPEAIAESLLSFPGMRLLHAATPSCWEWRARWESGGDFIEVSMTLMSEEVRTWGGSPIAADCQLKDMEDLWSHLQERHQGVWLHHSDCIIHTRHSFRRAGVC